MPGNEKLGQRRSGAPARVGANEQFAAIAHNP